MGRERDFFFFRFFSRVLPGAAGGFLSWYGLSHSCLEHAGGPPRAPSQRKRVFSARVMTLFHLNFCSTFCKDSLVFAALCLDLLPCVSRGKRRFLVLYIIPVTFE